MLGQHIEQRFVLVPNCDRPWWIVRKLRREQTLQGRSDADNLCGNRILQIQKYSHFLAVVDDCRQLASLRSGEKVCQVLEINVRIGDAADVNLYPAKPVHKELLTQDVERPASLVVIFLRLIEQTKLFSDIEW